jgi:hypothetical protein
MEGYELRFEDIIRNRASACRQEYSVERSSLLIYLHNYSKILPQKYAAVSSVDESVKVVEFQARIAY